jgi:hypothetical protein
MKLPVFKAIGATFGLVLGRFATLAQIAWLPMLAMSGVTAWFLWNLLPVLSNIVTLSETSRPEEVAAAVGPLALPMLLTFAVSLIFMPMLFAGLLRYIVRGERPAGPFYLHFGGDELRVLGTYITIVLINLGIGLATGIVGGVLITVLGGKDAPAGALTQSLIELAVRIVQIWIALRLSLAFPSAIGARAVGIGPSWQLTRGNTLALLGYWALWYVALFAVVLVLCLPFLSGMGALFEELSAVAGNDAAAKQFLIDKVRSLSEWIAANGQTLWIALGVHFVFSLVITIVQVSAAGVAYRLIKAEGADGA